MTRFLLVCGIVFAAIGLFAIGFGVPNRDFSVGSTMILSGAALMGAGVVLIGLSTAVAELQRIAALLERRDGGLTVRSAERVPAVPMPEPVSMPEVPEIREELPNYPDEYAPARHVDAPVPRHGIPRDQVPDSRPRKSDITEGGEPSGQLFDSLWPAQQEQPQPRRPRAPAPARGNADAVPPPGREPARPQEAPARPAVTVIKSGIVDGMAYTLFSDGSIEAELADGPIRFASIDALRAHLDARG